MINSVRAHLPFTSPVKTEDNPFHAAIPFYLRRQTRPIPSTPYGYNSPIVRYVKNRLKKPRVVIPPRAVSLVKVNSRRRPKKSTAADRKLRFDAARARLEIKFKPVVELESFMDDTRCFKVKTHTPTLLEHEWAVEGCQRDHIIRKYIWNERFGLHRDYLSHYEYE